VEASTQTIIDRLRATPDMEQREEIAGLTRKPHKNGGATQQCHECIYFLPNHAFCNLPELNFPVNADWWCRLWRM
jgi:hypothetical protein